MTSYIYFMKPIGVDGPIKIGWSNSPVTRLAALAAWSPFPLEILGCIPAPYDDEQFLHKCFAESHSHHEWFAWTPLLGQVVKAVLLAGTVAIVRGLISPKGNIRTLRQKRRTPAQCKFFSYSHRIRWVQKRQRQSSQPWRAPEDVEMIMDRWSRNTDKNSPSATGFARLDEYLADPSAHAVLSKPKLVSGATQ